MQNTPIREGDLLWEPSERLVKNANITAYMKWLKAKKGLDFDSYDRLWDWSVTAIDDFWQSVWEFFRMHQQI